MAPSNAYISTLLYTTRGVFTWYICSFMVYCTNQTSRFNCYLSALTGAMRVDASRESSGEDKKRGRMKISGWIVCTWRNFRAEEGLTFATLPARKKKQHTLEDLLAIWESKKIPRENSLGILGRETTFRVKVGCQWVDGSLIKFGGGLFEDCREARHGSGDEFTGSIRDYESFGGNMTQVESSRILYLKVIAFIVKTCSILTIFKVCREWCNSRKFFANTWLKTTFQNDASWIKLDFILQVYCFHYKNSYLLQFWLFLQFSGSDVTVQFYKCPLRADQGAAIRWSLRRDKFVD